MNCKELCSLRDECTEKISLERLAFDVTSDYNETVQARADELQQRYANGISLDTDTVLAAYSQASFTASEKAKAKMALQSLMYNTRREEHECPGPRKSWRNLLSSTNVVECASVQRITRLKGEL